MIINKTKNQYKIEIKAKLSQILADQWSEPFEEFRDHPNIFTPEEAAEMVKCSDAVREVRAELEGEEAQPTSCVTCGSPVLTTPGYECADCS